MFSKFSSNESGASIATTPVTALSAAVQPRCISLQIFALCAMAATLQSPIARLGRRFVCTTSGFAQKKDTRPVGGRGISAFKDVFSLTALFFRPEVRGPLRSFKITSKGTEWRYQSTGTAMPSGQLLGNKGGTFIEVAIIKRLEWRIVPHFSAKRRIGMACKSPYETG